MEGFSGPSAPASLGPGFSISSQSPTPSPSPSHSHSASASLTGSGQKRKRSDDHASSLGFAGNHSAAGHHPHTFSNLHPSAAAHSSHPSSVSHESRDGPATSLEEDEENATGGDESGGGPNHSQLDSISAGDPDGREEYEEEEEDDDGGNEDDGEQDDEDGEEDGDDDEEDTMRTFTAARLDASGARPVVVKAEGLQPMSNVKVETTGETAKDSAPAQLPSNALQSGAGGVKDEQNKLATADTIQTSGAYCSREENFKREEDAGRLKFVCYSNDGIDQHMIWLIGLKNIFARQLPNMPKEYIVRLVMDRL